MTEFTKTFEKLAPSDKAEKSFKEFHHWFFGITIGISALLLFQMNDFNLEKYYLSKELYIVIVSCSLLNTLWAGYNEYIILKRATRMSVAYGQMEKYSILHDLKNISHEEIKGKWTIAMDEWWVQYNKISRIGKNLSISLITTLIMVVITGVFILTLL